VDLDWVFATSFFDCVQATETAMDMALVREVGVEIKTGGIKNLANLEAFVLASKPLSTFKNEDRNIGSDWLMLKYRQELCKWHRTVLERFFRKIVDGELMSVVEKTLITNVNRQLARPKSITCVSELEQYLKSITSRYPGAFAWLPKHEERAALAKFHDDPEFCFMDMNMNENPGCWLKLKIRQELCAFLIAPSTQSS